jgi:hypothetical protein
MQRPHCIVFCTPPCIVTQRAATLFAVQYPKYTAIQLEDSLQLIRHARGLSIGEVLESPKYRSEAIGEFTAFLEAGLELGESLILSGPFWSVPDRHLILDIIPNHYCLTAITQIINTKDFFDFNRKHRRPECHWPISELTKILADFELPTTQEGFEEIHMITQPMDIPYTVAA